MLKRLRNYLMAGVIVLLPAAVTFYILWVLFRFLDGAAGEFVLRITGWDVPGLGVLLTLTLVLLAGILTRSFMGRAIIRVGERLMTRIPLVRSVYLTVKQVVDAFCGRQQKAFRQVVLLEYPRKGVYAIAFLTGETRGEAEKKIGKQLVNIFLPTTPNPTSGFFLLVPKEELIFLDMPVEDGIKMVVSGGIVTPPYRPAPVLSKYVARKKQKG